MLLPNALRTRWKNVDLSFMTHFTRVHLLLPSFVTSSFENQRGRDDLRVHHGSHCPVFDSSTQGCVEEEVDGRSSEYFLWSSSHTTVKALLDS